jgi:hypothetical protein
MFLEEVNGECRSRCDLGLRDHCRHCVGLTNGEQVKHRKYRSQGVQSQSFAAWAKANNRTLVNGKYVRAEESEKKKKPNNPKVSVEVSL